MYTNRRETEQTLGKTYLVEVLEKCQCVAKKTMEKNLRQRRFLDRLGSLTSLSSTGTNLGPQPTTEKRGRAPQTSLQAKHLKKTYSDRTFYFDEERSAVPGFRNRDRTSTIVEISPTLQDTINQEQGKASEGEVAPVDGDKEEGGKAQDAKSDFDGKKLSKEELELSETQKKIKGKRLCVPVYPYVPIDLSCCF